MFLPPVHAESGVGLLYLRLWRHQLHLFTASPPRPGSPTTTHYHPLPPTFTTPMSICAPVYTTKPQHGAHSFFLTNSTPSPHSTLLCISTFHLPPPPSIFLSLCQMLHPNSPSSFPKLPPSTATSIGTAEARFLNDNPHPFLATCAPSHRLQTDTPIHTIQYSTGRMCHHTKIYSIDLCHSLSITLFLHNDRRIHARRCGSARPACQRAYTLML